ncbi:FecR family protein [Flexithrix dorotheae]|uniref:FecR family protein n=1 Tax=Flexithrix dorotheae TaxID=70993 RepID=UPI00035D3924|nr:FecR family protein [Flexithrix dorotheae]
MKFENIISYLTAEASETERSEVENWRAENPENEVEFQKVKSVWENGIHDFSDKTPDINMAWEKINPSKIDNKVFNISKSKNNFTWVYKIAAVILISLGLGIALMNWEFEKFGLEKVSALTTGQEAIVLADGTEVFLNKNAVLYFPGEFAGKEREVYLEGEAFFDVSENPEQPFIIHAGNTETRVLGTSFNLREDELDNAVEIVLVTGKVAFSTENKEVTLIPGETALWDETAGNMAKAENKNPNFLAWKNKKLEFTQTQMKDVIRDLERYFEVTIIVENKAIFNCNYTGKFENPGLEEIFKIMELGSGITFRKENNQYILSGGDCG